MCQKTVVDGICDALCDLGVNVLFGYPGGAILPFYDALHRTPQLRHILMRHEQAAAHAADGYARASGRVGVCVATSGPGATNLVTGLATAMMDGIPIIAITGQVPRSGKGMDFFQEADVIGLCVSITKHGFLLDNPDDVDSVVADAFTIATTGRTGPVVIDIPKDVQAAPYEPTSERSVVPVVHTPEESPEAALEVAAELLNRAKRPVVVAGRGIGVSQMESVLMRLVEEADLPVATTLLGLDTVPSTHSHALGLVGMHGTERANTAIQRADVILGLGLRFDDRVVGRVEAFAPKAQIIHANISPAHTCRLLRPQVELIGDLATTLPALASRVSATEHGHWWSEIRRWPKESAADPVDTTQSDPAFTARAACRALASLIASTNSAVATDVGQHQMLVAQELGDAAPGTFITSGGLGTMGFALPAGIGAAIARPDRPTWVIAGDGGFQMTLQELATVVQEGIPMRIAIVNNGFLGMVRQWQEFYHERRYASSQITGPNLEVLAKAYGIPARTVTNAKGLGEALAWAESVNGPTLLDLQVVSEENVFPMVGPGASLSEMQLSETLRA